MGDTSEVDFHQVDTCKETLKETGLKVIGGDVDQTWKGLVFNGRMAS